MSEMFTKIGGYIASGDPLVYSDSATMTGDGTVASPFGVNKTDMFVQSPLFTGTSGEGDNVSAYIGCNLNETVLWSGTGNSGTTITLSEPLENFEKVGIFWEPFAAFGRDPAFEITPSYNDNVVNPYKRYAMFQQIVNNNHNGYLNCSLTVSSDGTSFGQYLYGYTNGDPSNFWTDHADWTIYKIIGINRKPEA